MSHSSQRENNHGLKLKRSVFRSDAFDDKNKKLTVTTDDADTRARRMGDNFPLSCPKMRTFAVAFTMAVAVATLCEIINRYYHETGIDNTTSSPST